MIFAIGAIVVARLLGPLNYGLYTLTVTIPPLLVALADVGMNYALVRLPARLRAEGEHGRANRLIRLGFILKLAISTIAFIVCYADSTNDRNSCVESAAASALHSTRFADDNLPSHL